MQLSEVDIERYSRQLILPSWSQSRQIRLADTTVALPYSLPSCAMYLLAAGIRRIRFLPDAFGKTAASEAAALRSALLALDPAACLDSLDEGSEIPRCSVHHLPEESQLRPDRNSENTIVLLEKESEILPFAGPRIRLESDFVPFALSAGSLAASLILKHAAAESPEQQSLPTCC